MDVGWTDGLGEDGPEIRVPPSSKRRSCKVAAIGPEIAIRGVITGESLREQGDAEGVRLGERVGISV